MLAYGSNGAPSQLARKYGDVPGAVIPVLQAAVRDVDVVYSAHITRYGAIPATLAESHGTILRTSITWLSDRELEVMHESEMGSGGAVPGNYTFGRFERLSVVSRGLSENRKMSAYVSRFGALGLHEAPIALARVTAEHRTFAEYSKIAMLGAVARSPRGGI